MLRFIFAVFAFIPLSFSQNLPAFRWVHQVDNSGSDSFAGLGVDAQGNTYVAGSTPSASFPVKAAAQNHLASAGLYRIDGPGQAYTALGLTSAQSITADPQNPNTLYATSSGHLMKSTDGGVTFSALTLPSSQVYSFAINPANDQILYAGTFDQGMLKSADGGVTWSASNGSLTGSRGQFSTQGIWIDPGAPNTLYANTSGNLVRSDDGGVSWSTILIQVDVVNITFDASTPGVIYAAAVGNGIAYKSTDHGLSFTNFPTPVQFGTILSDPNHPGRLLGSSTGGIYESTDAGVTWTVPKLNLGLTNSVLLTPDWASGFLYIALSSSSVLRITADLKTTMPVGPPATGYIQAITAANGHAYVAVSGTQDVYVTKLDPSGNVVYSTYFGGSADDNASAMTVDASGNVYVTGTTTSLDFPVTKGTYSSKGSSFLFRLNPDGSVGYSTYFASSVTPVAIAVDGAGSAYLAGTAGGNLPVTPGAYQSTCNCAPISTGFLTIIVVSGFTAKFDSTGSNLLYSTYIGGTNELESVVNTLALASDGTAYVAGQNGIYHLNGTGTALLSSSPPIVNARAMTVAADGSVYLAGPPGVSSHPFQTTAGAFQPAGAFPAALPGQVGLSPATAIARMDAPLANVLAATYFGGAYDQINVMTLDQAGNLYVAGSTGPQGLPTRTPLQGGFAGNTGFLSELTGDLSSLLFSSYFGDNELFSVQGLAASPNGSVVIGGATGQANAAGLGPMNVYVNSLTLTPPPALRIDAVVNAASLLDTPLSAGETIVVRGAGFGSDTQLTIGTDVVPALSMTSTTITAVVPQTVPMVAAQVQVQSGGVRSNQVLVPVNASAPGVFSQNVSGYGQGYILNKDGTLNTPSNPAATGDRITIFATGVGPVSFTQGYAVTQFPVDIYIDGFYANGVSAVMTPVDGLPGSVYQITVLVPKPSDLAANNPDLKNFRFPPLVGLIMRINGVNSQNGIALSIAQ
jgi:uncharacterized protein (TIGR03437 family)